MISDHAYEEDTTATVLNRCTCGASRQEHSTAYGPKPVPSYHRRYSIALLGSTGNVLASWPVHQPADIPHTTEIDEMIHNLDTPERQPTDEVQS